MTRRDFIRLGALASTIPFLEACTQRLQGASVLLTPTSTPLAPASPTAIAVAPTVTPAPEPTVIPTPTDEPGITKVALVRTSDRVEGMKKALELLGIKPAKGKSVVLKANFNTSDPPPASTDTAMLRELVKTIWDMGARSITLLERSGMEETRRALQRKGIFDAAKELGFEAVVLDEIGKEGWEWVNPPDSYWRKGFFSPKACLESDCVIQVAALKTHRFGGHFTLSLKNTVGLVARFVPGNDYDYMKELHDSPHQRLMIGDVNTAYSPSLIVLDGIDAFVDGGPDAGRKVRAGVMLAGTDRIAVDAVGVAILRILGTIPQISQGPIFHLEQLARAVELGLGVASPTAIRLLTSDSESTQYAGRVWEVLNRSARP